MIYILKEIRSDKYDNGSETGTGEWEILEHFNMGVVAKSSYKSIAEYIVKSLNDRDSLKCEEGDLVQLAQIIRKYIKEWTGKYREGNYNDAVDFVVGKIMQSSKWYHLNPSIVRQLVLLERVAWSGSNYFLPC